MTPIRTCAEGGASAKYPALPMELEDHLSDDEKESLDKAAVENRRERTKYGAKIGDAFDSDDDE